MDTTFKPISFQEWIKNNPDVLELKEICEECEGTGEIECFHCGNVADCDECGGTGRLNTAQDLYEAQIREDKKKWEAFVAKLVVA